MCEARLLPHRYDIQGWTVVVDRDGVQVPLGCVGLLAEARWLASLSGADLHVSAEVRTQMSEAGCAPTRWPDDLLF